MEKRSEMDKLLILVENWDWLHPLVKPEVREKVDKILSSFPRHLKAPY